jgi:hypothetical protein
MYLLVVLVLESYDYTLPFFQQGVEDLLHQPATPIIPTQGKLFVFTVKKQGILLMSVLHRLDVQGMPNILE